ncbi:Mut7-C RNAse domain-containing protein [Lentisalinibacter sediminis]|uniref:Mut7-C RNAse domain-containing protein n=1 Tax=Lentisalinibacter sediminis TaxID=2992237 RepID=UPI00386E0F91
MAAPTDDPHAKPVRAAEFRFYEELNDFLPSARRKCSFVHRFTDTPSVKDTVEALGVPHTEIDVILVDGESVGFGHRLRGGERVAVYPVFECLDVSPLVRLRPAPLRMTRFIADVHLGMLARHLRLLGYDTVWRSDLGDEEIIDRSLAEHRIILTRDIGILRNGRVIHGYWLRATEPVAQLEEVVRALQLGPEFEPYTRCLECNGECVPIRRREAARQVPLQVFVVYRDFRRCTGCGRVYWPGSHLERLDRVIEHARAAGPSSRRA